MQPSRWIPPVPNGTNHRRRTLNGFQMEAQQHPEDLQQGDQPKGWAVHSIDTFEVGPASQCQAVATLSPLPRPQSITSTSPRGNRCGSTRGTSTTGSCWRRSGRRWRPRRAAPRPRQVGAAMVPLLSAGGFLFGCHSILFVRAIFLTNSSFVPIAGQILALS